jgi:hypothetical protein
MARLALVKNGVVDNVIVADKSFKPPSGFQIIESDIANIGERYDGKAFTRPAKTKEWLFEHAGMRRSDVLWTRHELSGDRSVTVDVIDRDTLNRYAERAARDAGLMIGWPQPHDDISVVQLNARDIVALNEAVTDWLLEHDAAFAGVLKGIASGKVVDDDGVDFPPSPLAAWPTRNDRDDR